MGAESRAQKCLFRELFISLLFALTFNQGGTLFFPKKQDQEYKGNGFSF